MRLFVMAAALALAACATRPAPADGPPSFAVAPGQPATPQARLYVDCIKEAVTANTYDRENGLIRFHCAGAAAAAFYDGLADWSAQQHSERIDGAATWRFTQPMRKNPDGLDYCVATTAADASVSHACTLVFNAGAFLLP